MKIYKVVMTYWTYWYDAYSSGYEKENHYFKEKENADNFLKLFYLIQIQAHGADMIFLPSFDSKS